MVGTTIASIIATESIRMVLLAAPIGPCGSRMFIAEPENGTRHNDDVPPEVPLYKVATIAFAKSTAATAVRTRKFSPALLELRNGRDGDVGLRQRRHFGGVANPARINRHIVHAADIGRPRRDTA